MLGHLSMTRNFLGRPGGPRIPSGETIYGKPLMNERVWNIRSMPRNC